MSKNIYFSIVSVVFLIIGLVHGTRVLNGWEATMGGFVIPFWASYVAVLVTFYLSFQAFKFKKNS